MASLLFRDAIDYLRVRIHGRRYTPFQPKNCAMTPKGSMYFHAFCFLDDYAQASPSGQHWFIHEMVNLWQCAHLQLKGLRPKRPGGVPNTSSSLF